MEVSYDKEMRIARLFSRMKKTVHSKILRVCCSRLFHTLDNSPRSKGNQHNQRHCDHINHANNKPKRELINQGTKTSKHGRKQNKRFHLRRPSRLTNKNTPLRYTEKGCHDFCSMPLSSVVRPPTTT